MTALSGIRIVDVSGTIATGYCGKLFADYGAHVINLEPEEGFQTRSIAPFLSEVPPPDNSALHAYLSTNKESVVTSKTTRAGVLGSADLVLDDGSAEDLPSESSRMSITWYGLEGPFADFETTDAHIFAMNGMLRGIGKIEGPPYIPPGYQAQILAGATAYIGALGHILGRELGNLEPSHLETSIFEAMMCFTDVGAVAHYNTGLELTRLGINRFPPTYPLGIFPCKDGWLGVTVLTPSQWHAFCELLDMEDLAEIPLFQSSVGRLEAIDIIEPRFTEALLDKSAEALFYAGQAARIPLARVPTMEELFQVDQFMGRNAFSDATVQGHKLTIPSVPFRLYATPPHFGGSVERLGQSSSHYE